MSENPNPSPNIRADPHALMGRAFRQPPGEAHLKWFYLMQVCTAVFLQCTLMGSVFGLYMDELGLNAGQIGAAVSAFPFLQALALVSGSFVERAGFRRIFLLGFGARALSILALAAAPWVLAGLGRNGAFLFVMGCLLAFGVFRSLGETALYPWLKELVPDAKRGRVQGRAILLSSVAAVTGMLLTALFVRNRETLGWSAAGPFQAAFLLFPVIGLCGVAAAARLPGGAAEPGRENTGAFARRLAAALGDRRFRRFLLGDGLIHGCMVLFVGLMPVYLRQYGGLPASHIVLLSIAQMAGYMAAGSLIGRLADRFGSRRVLIPTLVGMACMPLLWYLLPLSGAARVPLAYLAYALFGLGFSSSAIALLRLLYNHIIPADARKTEYLATRYACSGLIAGTVPLLGGWSVDLAARFAWPVAHPFVPLFIATALAWAACARLFASLGEDSPQGA